MMLSSPKQNPGGHKFKVGESSDMMADDKGHRLKPAGNWKACPMIRKMPQLWLE
jgi:hypothetical protein